MNQYAIIVGFAGGLVVGIWLTRWLWINGKLWERKLARGPDSDTPLPPQDPKPTEPADL